MKTKFYSSKNVVRIGNRLHWVRLYKSQIHGADIYLLPLQGCCFIHESLMYACRSIQGQCSDLETTTKMWSQHVMYEVWLVNLLGTVNKSTMHNIWNLAEIIGPSYDSLGAKNLAISLKLRVWWKSRFVDKYSTLRSWEHDCTVPRPWRTHNQLTAGHIDLERIVSPCGDIDE